MNVIGLNEYKEGNLRKLAAYLLKGDLMAEFNMSRYSDCPSNGVTECGTVGCAVGHGPYAGIPKKKDETWEGYAYRCFLNWQNSDGDLGRGPHWRWCFGGEWTYADNTPKGAAKRILWLLDKGLPDNWAEQMSCKEKLCYVWYFFKKI